ncbi:MAG: hypothetical protein ACKVQA_17500, partial [Burkholderiales bacterium]
MRDPELRALLLDYFVANDSAEGISNWLSDLGQATGGKVGEKRERVRAHTRYLETPWKEFPDQTCVYLDRFSTSQLA